MAGFTPTPLSERIAALKKKANIFAAKYETATGTVNFMGQTITRKEYYRQRNLAAAAEILMHSGRTSMPAKGGPSPKGAHFSF